LEKILKISPNSRLGKMNILYTMMQDLECQEYFARTKGQKVTKEIYDLYLQDEHGKFIDDKSTVITPQIAIDKIHAAGGIAIIAHPFLDIKDMNEMQVLKEQGLDGLEIQPRGNGENEKFREFAMKNNLLITYGSDYHGGAFGRAMLDNKGNNILSERLAEALRIN
jgi:predicted metal-dependent phosphoesterase TrpH